MVRFEKNKGLSALASSATARSLFQTRLYRFHPWNRPALLYLRASCPNASPYLLHPWSCALL